MTLERNDEGVPPASYQLASQVALRVLLTAGIRLHSLHPNAHYVRTSYSPIPLSEIATGKIFIK